MTWDKEEARKSLWIVHGPKLLAAARSLCGLLRACRHEEYFAGLVRLENEIAACEEIEKGG